MRSRPARCAGWLIQVGVFALILLSSIGVTAAHLLTKRWLQLDWRALAHRAADRPLDGGRPPLPVAARTTGEHDNPDQRIAEDIRIATETAIALAHTLVYSVLIARTVRRDPLVGVGHDDGAGHHHADARLHGSARVPLRGRRRRARLAARTTAGAHDQCAADRRGRFPFRPLACARALRGDRAGARRIDRARALLIALRADHAGLGPTVLRLHGHRLVLDRLRRPPAGVPDPGRGAAVHRGRDVTRSADAGCAGVPAADVRALLAGRQRRRDRALSRVGRPRAARSTRTWRASTWSCDRRPEAASHSSDPTTGICGSRISASPTHPV